MGGEAAFKPKYVDGTWDCIVKAGMDKLYDWEVAKGKFVHADRSGISDLFLPDESPMTTVERQANPTKPALWGDNVPEITLKDGTVTKCRTVWDHLYDNCKDYTFEKASEKASEITVVKADLMV